MRIFIAAYCLRYDGTPPTSQRQCYIPCSDDCTLSPWSAFGPCSQTCGPNPGTMVRRRTLLAAGRSTATPTGDASHAYSGDAPTDEPGYASSPPARTSLAAAATRLRHSLRESNPTRNRVRWQYAMRKHQLFHKALGPYAALNNRLYRIKRTMNLPTFVRRPSPLYRSLPLPYNGLRLSRPYRDALVDVTLNSAESPASAESAKLSGDPSVQTSPLCPHLSPADFQEVVPCGQERCPTYSWEVGEWGSCLLPNGEFVTPSI